MDKKDVVILGNGLLGSQLHEMTGWSLLSREDDGFDITKPETLQYILPNIISWGWRGLLLGK